MSASTGTGLISVDVDPKVPGCPRCLHPFVPPVFQCAAGHLLCSTCHGNLQDKEKCVSCFIKTGYTRCFIPTSYSRCHAVEHIVRSVHVACLYSVNGCTAKMLYHEKAEHEKTCPNMYGLGGLPGRVVKMGPCGGGGGDARDMNPHFVDRITNVILRHGGAIYAIAVLLQEDEDLMKTTNLWGTLGGVRSEICLEPDEYLTSVRGCVGHYEGWFVVRSLTFVGNRRTFGPYGTEGGTPFELPAAGGRIVGFHGRSGGLLDALGTNIRIDD